ncbi:MAG: hypothetical protein ACYSU7_12875 [Planctomycetota bacterium]
MTSIRRLLPIMTVGAVVAATVSADPPQYAIRYLGEASKIEGINASGVITGWRLSPSPARSFVVGVNQPYTLLPLPDGYISSLSWGINDAGVVVGDVSGAGQEMATAWYPDGRGGYTIELLGALPGHEHSVAYAINNRGDIVGESINPGWAGGPTVWFNAPGGIMNLQTLGAPSRPTAVNDSGLVVGWGDGYFDLDTLTSMPYPPGGGGLIWGMNNHGDLCGFTATSSETIAAVRWTEAFGWQQLGGSINQSAQVAAYDINDNHVTVGYMVGGTIYFDEHGLLSLFDLLAPEYANWGLDTRFSAINNAGQIACTAWNDNLDLGGVALLTPLGQMIIPGDVNGDAWVDLDDHCAWQQNPIDLNGDGVVDDADEQWLIDRLAGLGFIVADCNGNGIGDHCDIVDGTSLDCDGDDVPDECQADCNGDGVPDTCEPDCNGNGVSDPCDFAEGTSDDCNANGIPDECDGGGVTETMVVYDPSIEVLESAFIVEDMLVVDVGIIDDADFTIDIGYRTGDLTVLLSHNGTTITLIDRPGHPETFLGNGQLGYDIILDDEGTGGPIEDEGNFGSPFEPIVSPPSFTPKDPLSTFDGMPGEGVWTITVVTTPSFSPVGSFNDWGLTITRASVPVPPCNPADLDKDGTVGILDFLALLAAWGPCGDCGNCPADLDGDCQVGVNDFLILLANWGG